MHPLPAPGLQGEKVLGPGLDRLVKLTHSKTQLAQLGQPVLQPAIPLRCLPLIAASRYSAADARRPKQRALIATLFQPGLAATSQQPAQDSSEVTVTGYPEQAQVSSPAGRAIQPGKGRIDSQFSMLAVDQRRVQATLHVGEQPVIAQYPRVRAGAKNGNRPIRMASASGLPAGFR